MTTVLCHGHFDVLHPGHIAHLNAARRMGDTLIVSITGDDYVTKPFSPKELESIHADTGGLPGRINAVARQLLNDAAGTVERPLSIDTPEQMVASILSKKLAAGSSHLLIDVPVGPTAKVRSVVEATRLRKLFEFVGDHFGLAIEVVTTDGSQPIGFGIGHG